MARKTALILIGEEGRDKGKQYLITEMDADRAESWALRALMALAGGTRGIPPELVKAGMAGLAEVGVAALVGLSWDQAKPLLDEMMDCVQIVPDPKAPNVVRPLVDGAGDIEEVSTRIKLRAEVWKIHVDFLSAAKTPA